MPERTHKSYSLLRQFHAFYAELDRLRRVALAGISAASKEPGAKLAPASPTTIYALPAGAVESSDAAPQETSIAVAEAPGRIVAEDPITILVWQEMAQYLDQKLLEMKIADSALSRGLLEELTYIMAAFADETFACLLDWPGTGYWREHLMELRLFRSQISGQQIFRRIEAILTRHDYGSDELAAVYLMILALGFKGRYFREPEAVEFYRRKLFDRLRLTNPEWYDDSFRIMPEAYRYTVTEGAPIHLAEPKTWWMVAASVVVVWLMLSTLAWWQQTASTRAQVANTLRSLDQITAKRGAAKVSQWERLPFEPHGDAFQLSLPEALPLKRASSGQSFSIAPLMIAVSVQGSSGTEDAAKIRLWLAQGSITIPGRISGAAPAIRPVGAVEQIYEIPGGVSASRSTALYRVMPDLSTRELELHPRLTFPVVEESTAKIATISLYIPQAVATGAQ